VLILLLKSQRVGGWPVGWLENCVSCQTQRVVIKGVMFCWGSGTGGVPQGTILGPVLVNIFVSDLDDGTECTISGFANTQLEGVVDTLDEFAAVRWDLGHVEKRASRDVMNFQGKCRVLLNCFSQRYADNPLGNFWTSVGSQSTAS